jgi:ABC-type transport system involved in multi-copper enzyme maturation permease subunit
LLGPIFAREFLTVPRRARHYVTRVAYLGGLWVLGVTAWLATDAFSQEVTIGETARLGRLLFVLLTTVQLSLFLFFSALSAASAVAQEKDRRTFLLLLMTEMTDFEIVLGKVLGSLLPIGLLLTATIPVLALLTLLGGIGLGQVLYATLVTAATVLAAGSLGGLVALWRDRTFQSLALTVLFLVLYFCLVRVAATLGAMAWLEWLDPFVALGTVHDGTATLASGLSPAYGYTLAMLTLTVLLNGCGVFMLRKWNPSGEPIMQAERPEDLEEKDRTAAHAAPGKARQVGVNPILWREIFTRAYGRRPLLVKAAYFIALGLICWSVLAPVVARGGRTSVYDAAYGLLPVGVLSLLLVSAQAATSITSERDTGALDLLLVTDLTAKEFIFGKLGGILYNTKEYLVPPLMLAGIYGWYGCLATPPARHPEQAGLMNATALVCVVGAAVVLMAFAMVLGIHVALRTPNSRVAIIHTLGTIFFLSVGTLVCIALIVINGRFEYQWTSFLFFVVAGVGGLWWVLNAGRPSAALTWASWFCPLGVLYCVMNILVAKPGSQESADPLMPLLVIVGAFGFTITAMLIPLLSEFDVAMGRTSGGAD